MALPEIGIHVAKPVGKIVIAERAVGQDGLQAFIPCEVCEGEHAGSRITAIRTIVSKEGAVQMNEVEKLKEIFGIVADSADPNAILNGIFGLMDADQGEKRFEIDVQDEEYNGKVSRKVKWINPLGGGGMKMPEPADRRSVLQKYGSKFRAIAGGTPVNKPAARPAVATPPKPKTPPVPQTGPTSTMEECWEIFCKEKPEGTAQEQLEKEWFALQKSEIGKDDNNLTPHEWGKLKGKLEDNVPY